MTDLNIRMLQLIEGAKAATGLVVIIDVFRAFSLACYAFAGGAERIIPVGTVATAHRLKAENPDRVLIGERDGKKLPGCDYGNSPSEIETVDFTGRTIIHTTSAGTQGIVNATGADEIITGSFVNAGAIVRYIQSRPPETVSLVAMGTGGMTPAEEDTFCAEFLRDRLEGRPPDFSAIRHRLRHAPAGAKFFDPQKDWFPEPDFDRCMIADRFNFVLRVKQEGDHPVLQSVPVPDDPALNR